jgi:hypothetical protein
MEFGYYDANSELAGRAYGQWTTLWWQWVLSFPRDGNPAYDKTGIYCGKNQPKGIWYLAGILAEEDEQNEIPVRACTIPSTVPILVPVLNCEADFIAYSNLKTDQELLDHLSTQVDSITKKQFYINNQQIPSQRVVSEPAIFDIYIHPDHDKKYKKGGWTRAVADGYWVCLRPLPIGEYELKFEGSCEYGRLNSGAKYNLTVS